MDLPQATSLVYVEVGNHPPYVGQVGAIIEPRPPAERHFDHARTATSLANQVSASNKCKRRREARTKLPPLPTIMARNGVGCNCMFPLQVIPPPCQQSQTFVEQHAVRGAK